MDVEGEINEIEDFILGAYEILNDNDILSILKTMKSEDVRKLCEKTPEISRFCSQHEEEIWLWFLERDFTVDPTTVPRLKARESYLKLESEGIKKTDDETEDSLNIIDIVNMVIEKEFDIDAEDIAEDTGKKLDVLEITKDPTDETRPFKDIATDFVVDEFFKTKTPLYRFLRLVYTTFEDALGYYREIKGIDQWDLFFLYKGGNILRIVSSEFLLELPANATKELNEFYSPFFKRSDADFTIYLHPEIPNYEERYHEITVISYLLQDYIRDIFQTDLPRYFDFPKYNEDYQRRVMESYFEKFNSIEGYSFTNMSLGETSLFPVKTPFYRRNPDITLKFFEENFGEDIRLAGRIVIPEDEGKGIMTVTHNDALDFPNTKGDQRIKFNLTRTKVLFALKQKQNVITVGGELIDVSMNHRDDSTLAHFFSEVRDNVRRYSLKYEDCVLNFNSYDLKYLIEDLENILFFQRNKPWEDRKYAKRINRLFYLDFVDIFMRVDSSFGRIELLWDIRDLVFKPIADVDNLRDIQAAQRGINVYEQKHAEKELYIHSLVLSLRILLNKIDLEDLKNLKEMGELLIKNANLVIKTIENVRQYCTIDGKIKESAIHEGGISQLL